MNSERRWQYVGGALFAVGAAAVLLAVFSMLSVTHKGDIFLMDRSGERFGWRYELLINGEPRGYTPEFAEDGNALLLPEGTQAVRITRTMTEEISNAELEWSSYLTIV